jgi:RNA polymerase sigma-70 factor (family 1)
MEKKAIYSPEAESQLLQEAANGSREAYAMIYQHYLPKLYKYLYDILRSKQDTEEILQELFLKLWEKKEELAEIKTLNSYLFRIARNRLMNYYDHQKVKQKATSYFSAKAEPIGASADDNHTYKEYSDVMEMALSALPPKRRLVFELSTIEELSMDEIATRLNISKSMVKKQLYAANNSVKEYLQLHAGLTASIAIAASVLFVK